MTSTTSSEANAAGTPPAPRITDDSRSPMAAMPTIGRRPSILGRFDALGGGASMLPLVVILLITFLDESGASAQAILGPEIRDYFGLDLGQITILTSIAGVATVLLSVPVGVVVDRAPRRILIAVGSVLVGVCSLISGLVPTIILFAIARSAAGVSRSLEGASTSFLADSYPIDRRASVFSARQAAVQAARGVAPLLAGAITVIFVWQATFLVLAVPSVALGIIALRMREPVRGEQERRAQGASEDVAMQADAPPSIAEGLRASLAVKSQRRILLSLPFLVGAALGFANLLSLYYDRVFEVGPGTRGALAAISEPFAIAGLVAGAALTGRLLRDRPAAVFAYGGALSVVSALAILGIAVAPALPVAVLCSWVLAFCSTVIGPAATSVLSLVIPARARGIGLSLGALAIVPGFAFIAIAGFIADGNGLRVGIAFLVPVFLVGAAIFASAGTSVAADIRAASAAAMAAEISRQAASKGAPKLLVCNDLDVGYGPVQILFNVDLEVEEGEIVALLGTNGAGKSTLLRAICGLTAPSNGAIFFAGTDITYLPAYEHAAQGIVQVPGGKGIFPGLSVGENLRLGAWRLEAAEAETGVEQILEYFPSLRGRMDEIAGNLSGGEQQMLTLSQAFLAKPRLLMIDELSLGLAPAIVEQLLVIVRAIHESGTTIILVEQSVNVALTVAKRAVFMEKGEVRFSGPTEELMRRPDILRSVYLQGSSGIGATAVRPDRLVLGPGGPERVLDVVDLRKRFGGKSVINGISFHLDDGQILGIIGPNGAGKTTLFDLLSGFVRLDDGLVSLLGEDVTDLTPDVRAARGLVRSFQDARLFPSLTVAENLAVALDRQLSTRSAALGAIHSPTVARAEAKITARADRLVELFGLGSTRDKFVRELSTGQRRVVDMACVLAAEPKVLLLDEPSSGIAQKEAEELGPLLLRIQAETGAALIVIEHDMPLLSSISDEFLALELGAVVTRGTPREVLDNPRVIASYLGTDDATINRSGVS